ncbi:MAG TPA: homoserine dehydrogenase [Gemmatimonadaceae bacterium]|nr:homoserine dehydrogenase [Gemmatimonadaceae bacterium]
MAPLQLPHETRPPREQFVPASRSHRDLNLRHERAIPRAEIRPEPRRVRVALAGCGVVGGGLVRLLHDKGPGIASRFGVRFEITAVLVRDVSRDRNLSIDPNLFTDDVDEFLSRDADVVVEAVGGEEPARSIAAHALENGRKFITANKDLVASHGIALAELADANDAGLDFGAAVGGSVPIVTALRDVVGASTPLSVRGILNGTSNYVLSEIERGSSFGAALEAARCCGFAESDCSKDLDGRDSAAKLRIIAWLAFGLAPHALDLRRIPLPADPARLVRAASVAGGRLRVIAECAQLSGGRISASVEPTIVPLESGFGQTNREENKVVIDLGWGAPLTLSGAGAGGAPTATALLADLVGAPRPRNERGAAATRFVSSVDERKHRWLVSALIPLERVRAAASGAGIRVERELPGAADGTIITRPAEWHRLEALIAALDGIGAAPAIARYELATACAEAAR